jgi:hypothetical protein
VGGRFTSAVPQFTRWPAKWHVLGQDSTVFPGARVEIKQWSTGQAVTVTIGQVVADRVVADREGRSVRYVVAEIAREDG